MKSIQFTLILVILCVVAGTALECYECESEDDSNCGDDGYIKNKEYCGDLTAAEKQTEIQQVCLKAVSENNGVKETVRKCAITGLFNPCAFYNLSSAKYCSICNKDLCNGHGKLSTSFWMVVTLVIGVFIKKMI